MQSNRTVEGFYESKKYNYFDKLFTSYERLRKGTTLKVENDSTYYMQTCGSVMSGNWRVQGDSLTLIMVNGYNVFDSTKIENHKLVYFIKSENELQMEYFVDDLKGMDCLVKNKGK